MTIVTQLKARAEELRRSPHLTNEQIDILNEAAWQLRYADVPIAAEISAQALKVAARNDYSRGRALALRSLGWCQIRTDQCQAAEQNLEESRQILFRLDEPPELALVINGLGITKRQMGDYEAALAAHQTALRLNEKSNDSAGVIGVLLNFGGTNWRLGEYGQSLEYYYRALHVAVECGAFVVQAHAYCGLGNLLWRVGEADESIRCAKRALALFETHQDRRNESITLNNLAAAQHSRGKHRAALLNYRRALRTAQAAGSVETQAEAQLGIGSIYCETNDFERALAYLSEALQLSLSIGSRFYESQARLALGTTYQQLGDLRQSFRLLENALEISEEIDAKETRYKTHLALSHAYEAAGHISAALFHYRAFHVMWNHIHGTATSRQVQRLLLERELIKASPNQAQLRRHQQAIIEKTAADHASDKEQSVLTQRKLRQIVDFIEQNLDQNIGIEELANEASLSQSHFHRAFKRSTGKTPHEFLLEQRVERVKLLLQTTALPLTEIALQCGFNSQSHLATRFRLVTGMTLRQFRHAS